MVSFGRLNVIIDVHVLKQLSPAVNSSGSVNVVAAAQPRKLLTPADVSSGSVNVVAAVQPSKQLAPAVSSSGKSSVTTDVQPLTESAPSVVQASNERLTNAALLNIPSCATVTTPLSVTVVSAGHKLNAPKFLPPAIAVTQSASSSIFSNVADVLNKDCFNVMPAPPNNVTSSPAVLILVNAVPLAGRSKNVFHAAKSFAGRLPGVYVKRNPSASALAVITTNSVKHPSHLCDINTVSVSGMSGITNSPSGLTVTPPSGFW